MSPLSFASTAMKKVGSGKSIFFTSTGCDLTQRVWLTFDALSFTAAPMSPEAISSASTRLLPWMK